MVNGKLVLRRTGITEGRKKKNDYRINIYTYIGKKFAGILFLTASFACILSDLSTRFRP